MASREDPVRTASAPMRRAGWMFTLGGVAFLGLCADAVLSGLWLGVALGGVMALACLYFGRYLGSAGTAVAALNLAGNALAEGRIGDADRLVAEVEAARPVGYARRAADLVAATIAWRRGDLGAVVARAGAAVERPLGRISRIEDRIVRASAQALRALGRASLGDVEGARQDIAAVRASPDADPEAVARAEIAEAVALERSGDRPALRRHLAERRALLLGRASTRDRSIVRAFQRMLAAPRTTVYRVPAPHERAAAPEEQPAEADWLSVVAPAAAPFAREERREEAHPGAAPAPLDEAEMHVARTRLARRGEGAGRLLLWSFVAALVAVVTGVGAAVIAALLGPPEQAPPDAVDWSALVGPVWACAVFVAAVVVLARIWRISRRAMNAPAALLRGEPGILRELEAMTQSSFGSFAAPAELHLARRDEARGDLATALARCDRGIAAAKRDWGSRLYTAQQALPDLLGERAFLLAATDRSAAARAELAIVAEAFPTYADRGTAELRVALVNALRSGDLAAAAALAEGPIDDLTLSLRDETLLDMARVVARPETAAAGERERIQAELRDDPELARWVDLVAPALMSAFTKSCAGDGDAAAEEEAAAVEEATVAARARQP